MIQLCTGPNYRKLLERLSQRVNSSHLETKSKANETKLIKRQGDNQQQKKQSFIFFKNRSKR